MIDKEISKWADELGIPLIQRERSQTLVEADMIIRNRREYYAATSVPYSGSWVSSFSFSRLGHNSRDLQDMMIGLLTATRYYEERMEEGAL